MTENTREAFEKWAKQTFTHVTNPAEPDLGNPGGYYWPAMHNAWVGWQAAWDAALEQAADVVESFDACDPKHIAAAIRSLAGEGKGT